MPRHRWMSGGREPVPQTGREERQAPWRGHDGKRRTNYTERTLSPEVRRLDCDCPKLLLPGPPDRAEGAHSAKQPLGGGKRTL